MKTSKIILCIIVFILALSFNCYSQINELIPIGNESGGYVTPTGFKPGLYGEIILYTPGYYPGAPKSMISN